MNSNGADSVGIRRIIDGTSNTLLLGEVQQRIGGGGRGRLVVDVPDWRLAGVLNRDSDQLAGTHPLLGQQRSLASYHEGEPSSPWLTALSASSPKIST